MTELIFDLKINGNTIEMVTELENEGKIVKNSFTTFYGVEDNNYVRNLLKPVENDLWEGMIQQVFNLDTDCWITLNDILDIGSKMAVFVYSNTAFEQKEIGEEYLFEEGLGSYSVFFEDGFGRLFEHLYDVNSNGFTGSDYKEYEVGGVPDDALYS